MGYVSTGMGDRLSELPVSLMALRLTLVDQNPFQPCLLVVFYQVLPSNLTITYGGFTPILKMSISHNDKRSFKKLLDPGGYRDNHYNQITCSWCHCQHFPNNFHQNLSITLGAVLQTYQQIFATKGASFLVEVS